MARRKRKAAADDDPCTPGDRAFGEPKGTRVRLADGQQWTLSGALDLADTVWNQLYDDWVLRGQYRPATVLAAAYLLLRDNYRLSPAEAFDLFLGVDPASLVVAVERPLFGPPPKQTHRTWADWVETSLWANGIDPATVPPDRFVHVMDILVETGRTVKPDQFISSEQAMVSRRRLGLNQR